MKKKQTEAEMITVNISAILFGRMKVMRYTLDDIILRMSVPISRNSLCTKLRTPEKFRLGELLNLCEVLGIKFEELGVRVR